MKTRIIRSIIILPSVQYTLINIIGSSMVHSSFLSPYN